MAGVAENHRDAVIKQQISLMLTTLIRTVTAVQ